MIMECKCESCVRENCQDRTKQDDLRIVINCDDYLERKPTNADRIRAMTDAELAEKIYQLNTLNAEGGDFSLLFCDGKANCIDSDGNVHCCEEREKACILRWLRQIAEE